MFQVNIIERSDPYVIYVEQRKRYGFFKFTADVIMTCVTGGLWLIWIFVREMRRR